MTEAFVETTVLTDYLLKRDGSEVAASATFRKYDPVSIPQFSWKEFKRGPLKNFVWTHNKLAETASFAATMVLLQRMSRSPHRYITSTAIQALHTAFLNKFGRTTLADLQRRYGSKANVDELHADLMRLELKRVIFSAWGNRNSLYGGPIQLLACYPDADLTQQRFHIDIEPRDCPKGPECCLKAALTGKKSALSIARQAIRNSGSQRTESVRRTKVLRRIEKHPTSIMDRDDCRSFGDAYFALFCPSGATIITTNLRDIEPMASALGIATDKP